LEQVKDLSAAEEANLLIFLQRIQNACKEDATVPDMVGLQVNDWLKEL
jgi:hypothetical protein